MNFNFFDWIRLGVKDSVLLGVTDAVNTMGMPPEESSRDKILSFLQKETQSTEPRRLPSPEAKAKAKAKASTAGQRKLGRSLNDVHTAKEV